MILKRLGLSNYLIQIIFKDSLCFLPAYLSLPQHTWLIARWRSNPCRWQKKYASLFKVEAIKCPAIHQCFHGLFIDGPGIDTHDKIMEISANGSLPFASRISWDLGRRQYPLWNWDRNGYLSGINCKMQFYFHWRQVKHIDIWSLALFNILGYFSMLVWCLLLAAINSGR